MLSCGIHGCTVMPPHCAIRSSGTINSYHCVLSQCLHFMPPVKGDVIPIKAIWKEILSNLALPLCRWLCIFRIIWTNLNWQSKFMAVLHSPGILDIPSKLGCGVALLSCCLTCSLWSIIPSIMTSSIKVSWSHYFKRSVHGFCLLSQHWTYRKELLPVILMYPSSIYFDLQHPCYILQDEFILLGSSPFDLDLRLGNCSDYTANQFVIV